MTVGHQPFSPGLWISASAPLNQSGLVPPETGVFHTGGLITFETADPSAATAAVEGDPFVKEGLLASYWLKEWAPE